MKKAVVYMLTAIVVTGSCLAPTAVYATEADNSTVVSSEEKTEENTPVVVTEAPTEEEISKDTEKPKEETEPKEETSSTEKTSDKKEEKTDKKDETLKEETKPKEEQKDETDKEEKPEEEKKLEKLDLSSNLNLVKNYVSGVTDKLNTSYFVKNDLVIIGYNYEGMSESDGFILPECFVDGYTVKHIWGELNETQDKFIWNVMKDVYTLEDLTKYVKDNLKTLSIKAGEKPSDKLVTVGSPAARPLSLLLFDGKTGDYVGSFQMNNKDGSAIYDDSICKLTGTATPKVSYNEDKTKATLSFDFSVSYPESMGGAKFLHFDLYTADKSDYFFTSTDAIKYVKDASGKVSGTVKDVPVNKSGDLLLKVNTTQGSFEVPFHVDKLNEPKDEGATGEVVNPKVTFSDLKKGVLDGTPTTLTMYSDVDATLIFNGESSNEETKEHTFTVRHNGTYSYVAKTKDGGETTGVFTVDCFVDSADAIDFGTYNQGGTTFLPQTGGMSTLAITLSGIFLMVGGIAIAKKDALMAMIRNHGRKVC